MKTLSEVLSVQDKMKAQRAAREARDGTPEQQAHKAKQAAGAASIKKLGNRMKKISRLAGQLSKLNNTSSKKYF
jgi:hypothetical protein